MLVSLFWLNPPISVMESGKLISVKLLALNAPAPIDLSESGSEMLDNALAENDSSPMDSREAPNSIFSKSPPANA